MRTETEIDRLKTSSREMYERENRYGITVMNSKGVVPLLSSLKSLANQNINLAEPLVHSSTFKILEWNCISRLQACALVLATEHFTCCVMSGACWPNG